eukprot:m.263972 g.263972  ORF g.263972 m.263972 type:complete len:329 (+) comp22768_c1_seq1:2526-3512(+)
MGCVDVVVCFYARRGVFFRDSFAGLVISGHSNTQGKRPSPRRLRSKVEEKPESTGTFRAGSCASASSLKIFAVVFPPDQAQKMSKKILCLFDVDGTLTVPRKVIADEMYGFLQRLRSKVTLGLVGGSDLVKIQEQMAGKAIEGFDFCFAENGLTAYKGGEELPSQSFIQFLGEERYQQLVAFILTYIADLKIPKKRGTFIEFRNGMINVSPIGRNCSRAERDEFEAFDKDAKVRQTMVKALEDKFASFGLKFSIGGQISFDVFPVGWDKTYCLRHVRSLGFDEIHFFGDKTFEGGNDFEIFTSEETIGHTVTSPEDTRKQLSELFSVE